MVDENVAISDVSENGVENGTADNDFVDDDLEVERVLDKIKYEDGKVIIVFFPLIFGKLIPLSYEVKNSSN